MPTPAAVSRRSSVRRAAIAFTSQPQLLRRRGQKLWSLLQMPTARRAALRPGKKQTIWTRLENADRTTDLLGAQAPPIEIVAGRVLALTGGYAHRIFGWQDGSAELGRSLRATAFQPR
jgi:hypothetical protein